MGINFETQSTLTYNYDNTKNPIPDQRRTLCGMLL